MLSATNAPVRARNGSAHIALALCVTLGIPCTALGQDASAPARPVGAAVDPAARAAETEARMTPEERVILTHGFMPGVGKAGPSGPSGSGYVMGIARLGIPILRETDASLGVADILNKRNDGGATPLPAALSTAATFNPALARAGGMTIGREARYKGFNVMLAGGANLVRDPRNGRNFEYLSEDPLLTGVMAGEAIAGIQSNHILSTVKHFAFNGQESARFFVNVKVSEAHARESDLLAFQIAIERGQPGAVMCAYNKVNGAAACDNSWLLNDVLKRGWRYPGFVMSDWGATPGLSAARNGLDQQSGAQLDRAVYFDQHLAEAAEKDPALALRVRDMNRRILRSIYAQKLDTDPPVVQPIDVNAGLDVAEAVAKEGIVLLRNQRNVLPLAAGARRLVVIGGYADTGVLSGGGSSQVQMKGGPAVAVPVGGDEPYPGLHQETYHRSNPLKAIQARAGRAQVDFIRGNYVSEAVDAARDADIVIVFATGWRTEGHDVPDLSLPFGQDALITAVAEANPNTVVVLETGGAVMMPWLDKTAAVLEAWYPGGRGGEAIASVLFGETNPSGRLPVTFPRSLTDLPRPVIAGRYAPLLPTAAPPAEPVVADYDIDGSDVGYRWNARMGKTALFPFGFGLSYTSFAADDLKTDGRTATFQVRNTGQRAGAYTAQLYLVATPEKRQLRLAGFQKVTLAAGASQSGKIAVDPRLLANWDNGGWSMRGGTYAFALGEDAEHLGPAVTVKLAARRWKD